MIAIQPTTLNARQHTHAQRCLAEKTLMGRTLYSISFLEHTFIIYIYGGWIVGVVNHGDCTLACSVYSARHWLEPLAAFATTRKSLAFECDDDINGERTSA